MFRKFSLGLVFSLACSTVAFAADAPASAASAADIPISAFCTFAKITNLKISPDGKYLAVLMADDKTGEDRKTLALITTEQPHKVTATFQTTGDQILADFWWIGNERVIAAGAERNSVFDRPFLDGSLYAVNTDGTQKYKLMPTDDGSRGTQQMVHAGTDHGQVVYFYGLLHRFNNDSKHVIIYGGAYRGGSYDQASQVYELDTYTGQMRQMLESPTKGGGLIADSAGNVRLATGVNTANGDPRLFYRPDGTSLDWKDMSGVYVNDDPAEPETGPAAFMPGDKHIYWYGRSATGTIGLFDLDPQSMALKPIFTDPEFDIDDLIGSFEWSDSREIVAVETMPGLPQVHLIDPDDAKADYLAKFYQAFEGQHVSITSNTMDHSKMIVFVDSDKNPGEYYLFDTKTGQAQFLFASKPEIDSSKMAAMQPIEYQARDGVKIHAYLTVPAGSSGKNLPLIINPHGGPHGIRDEWGFDPEVQLFVSRGYAVLQINYRGSGGYGMKFQDMGYQNWGTTMQDDLADGVAWAVKQGIADSNRICIYGGSYGGYAALENPIRYPDLYKCTVGYAGVYDITLFAHHGDTHHYASGEKYLDVVHGSDEERMKQYSPVYNVDKLKSAVFIVYGGHDQRVVPRNSEELMAAMDKLGKKYEVMYEPNEMHGFYLPDHRIELYTRMLAFFDKYIGPNAAKTSPAPAAGVAASKP